MKLQCPTPTQIQKFHTELASLEMVLKSFPTETVEERFKIYTHEKTIKALKKSFELLAELTVDGASLIPGILKQIETTLKERWEHIRGSFLCYTQSPQEPLNTLCVDIAKALYPLPAVTPMTPAAIETALQTAKQIATKAAIKAVTDKATSGATAAKALSEEAIKEAIEEATKTTTDEVTKAAIAGAVTIAIRTVRRPSPPKTTPETIIHQAVMAAERTAKTAIESLTEIELVLNTKLPFREGPYFLLMPSLEADSNAAGTNIHNFKTHQIVLSDRQDLFIPVAPCLETAGLSDRGEFILQVAKPADLEPTITPNGRTRNPNPYRRLSESERNRIAYHSVESEKYFHDIRNLNDERATDPSLGAALQLLAADLRAGGVNANGIGKGLEMNSGASANEGVVKFAKKWGNYTEDQKKALYEKYKGDARAKEDSEAGHISNPSLQELIERFIRSEKLDPKAVRFCVELTAKDLDTFISNYKDQLFVEPCSAKVVVSELSAFIKNVIMADEHFKKAIEQPNYAVRPGKSLGRLPALLLSESDAEQQKILKNAYPNFLIYGLLHPELIDTQFLLETFAKLPDAHSQKKLVDARDRDRATVLILAAKRRNSNFVQAIIAAGANINAQNSYDDTALNWAVFNGDLETMRILLNNNADLTIRCYQQKNAFETALASRFTDLIVPELCIKIFNSTPKIQKSILERVPGNYTDIATWAFHKHPATLSAILALPNSGLVAKLTTLYNDQALIQTISKGHQAPIIKALIAANPALKTTTEAVTGNTPLMVAVITKNKAAMELLLAENPDLSPRNKNNQNVLDLAIVHAPEFLPELSLKIFKSSSAKQRELFAQLSDKFATECFQDYDMCEWAFENGQGDTLSALVSSHKAAVITKLKELHERRTLIKAVEKGHKAPLIRVLITDAGLNINEKDALHQHDTALTQAATYANAPAMQLLLEHNADMTLRNRNGDNVFDIVIKKEPKILLKELCIKISSKPEAEQKQILEKQGGGKYNHIFCWAFDHDPATAMALLERPEVKEAEMAAKIKALHKDCTLILAVEKGYLSLIPHLGTPDLINVKDNDTAIIRAVFLKKREAVVLLLVQKPDLSITNAEGENALNTALKNDITLLPLLLAYIAPLPHEQRKIILAKFTLHQAVTSELNGFVQALIDIGVDINVPDTDKNTPLMKTVIQKSPGRIQIVLAKNPDLTQRNKEGKNVLDLTLELIKKPELVSQLLLKMAERYSFAAQKEMLSKLDNGRYNSVIDYVREKYPKDLPAILALPNVQKIIKNGVNLIAAVKSGATNTVQNILAEGTDINSQDAENDTALICATRQNSLELTQLISTHNPDLTIRNKAGDNALDVAVKKAPQLIEPILKNIGSYSLAHKKEILSKVTNLFDGIALGSASVLSAMLDFSPANITNSDSNNPLMMTVLNNKRDLMQLLLPKTSDLVHRNSKKDNVLDIAIKSAPELIPDLLFHCASTLNQAKQEQLLQNIEEGRYKTILSYAKAKHPQQVARLLLLPNVQAGIKKASEDLIAAVKAGSLPEVKDCIAKDGDINVQDSKNDTPLIWAAHDQYLEIAQFLLNLNPELTIRNTIANEDNILDIALRRLPKFIPELFTKIKDLPIEKQKEMCKKVTFMQAVTSNHLPLVQSIMTKGDINSTDENKDSALMITIKNKRPDIARSVLIHNPDLNLRNKQGDNALELAILNTPELIDELIPNISRHSGEARQEILKNQTIFTAVKAKSLPLVKLLIADGLVELNDECKGGLSALMFACYLENPEIATYLLTLNPNLSFRNGLNQNVIEIVIENAPGLLPQFMNKIAEKSADEIKELLKNVTLLQAAKTGHLQLIQTVFKERANEINLQNKSGNTALMLAVEHNGAEATRLILANDPNMTLRNTQGDNALDIALDKAPDLVPDLLLKIANLGSKAQEEALKNIANGRYKTILSYAQKCCPQIVPTLLKNPDAIAIEATAKLITAIESQTLDLTLLKELVAEGANINAQTQFKDTALLLAAFLNNPDMTRFLLEKNADMTIRNQNNENVFDIALNEAPNLVPDLLLKMATRPEAEQTSFLSRVTDKPIYAYIQDFYPLIIPAFLALPNIKSMEASAKLIMLGGSKALLKAATDGPIELVQALIEVDAEINIQDQQGNTPLTLAAANVHEEITQYLLWQKANAAIRNNKGESILTMSPNPTLLTATGLTDMTADFEAANRHLNALGFDRQVNEMWKKINGMRGKEHYTDAITAATTMVQKLEAAKLLFLQKNNRPGLLMDATNVSEFKTTCIKAIKDASPTLKEHREWLGIITNFLWTIITLGANRRWDFFALKTDSQKRLDAFEASFKDQNSSAPAA